MTAYCITCERERAVWVDETDEQYCAVCGSAIMEDEDE